MSDTLERFRQSLREEYERRFPRSRDHFRKHDRSVLDQTSHAIRWNEPFPPVIRKAEGAAIEDLDGHRILDYWQGHFANIHGHNPPHIRRALVDALNEGRGLQSGMLHAIEAEVSELICRCTGTEIVRLTTSGTLATLYATLLARGYTGRSRVLKVTGGWHGSQPFGLKGVVVRDGAKGRLESEGLWSGLEDEILLTRFNDLEDLRRVFERSGDSIACFIMEPMLGAAGGMPASAAYMKEARLLTEKHGTLLVCDEIVTGFRFRAGDCSSLYGVRPDLMTIGKILGGGMPVAAVAGRGEILELCTRGSGRVKFEGGTYSAHELSLVAARTQIRDLIENEERIYTRLGRLGAQLREGIARVSKEFSLPLFALGGPGEVLTASSMIPVHVGYKDDRPPACPEELVERKHPVIDERLLQSVLLLENVSGKHGLGSISTAHTEQDLDRTLDGIRAALARFRDAGLI